MTIIQQSAAWWSFVDDGRVSPEIFIRSAAEIGYSALELVEPEYWSMVADHGLKIAAYRAHNSLIHGLNHRENYAQIEDEFCHTLEQTAAYKIPLLICFSGNRNGKSDAEGAEITVENLQKLAPLAEKAGVTLILELFNSKINHPDYQADSTTWAVDVIKRVNSPAVKILFDIYHMQIMEGDIIRTIQQNHEWFGHYHTAGNPGRNEIDDSQELNYRAIFKAIAQTGYQGYIAHEFVPLKDPVESLKYAFDLCKSATEE